MGDPEHALGQERSRSPAGAGIVAGLNDLVIRLHDRVVLIASMYMEGDSSQALKDSCNDLWRAVSEARRSIGGVVNVVFVREYKRHN